MLPSHFVTWRIFYLHLWKCLPGFAWSTMATPFSHCCSPSFLFLSIAEPLWPLGYCLNFPMHPFVELLHIHLPNENIIQPESCLTHSLISFRSLFKCHLIRWGTVSVHPGISLYSFTTHYNFTITLIISAHFCDCLSPIFSLWRCIQKGRNFVSLISCLAFNTFNRKSCGKKLISGNKTHCLIHSKIVFKDPHELRTILSTGIR